MYDILCHVTTTLEEQMMSAGSVKLPVNCKAAFERTKGTDDTEYPTPIDNRQCTEGCGLLNKIASLILKLAEVSVPVMFMCMMSSHTG